jgi:hypothetical protein
MFPEADAFFPKNADMEEIYSKLNNYYQQKIKKCLNSQIH